MSKSRLLGKNPLQALQNAIPGRESEGGDRASAARGPGGAQRAGRGGGNAFALDLMAGKGGASLDVDAKIGPAQLRMSASLGGRDAGRGQQAQKPATEGPAAAQAAPAQAAPAVAAPAVAAPATNAQAAQGPATGGPGGGAPALGGGNDDGDTRSVGGFQLSLGVSSGGGGPRGGQDGGRRGGRNAQSGGGDRRARGGGGTGGPQASPRNPRGRGGAAQGGAQEPGGAQARRGGAQAPRGGNTGAQAPSGGNTGPQGGAQAPSGGNTGAQAPRGGNAGAQAPSGGNTGPQSGAQAPSGGNTGAQAPRGGNTGPQSGAQAPSGGNTGAQAPRGGNTGAQAPRGGQAPRAPRAGNTGPQAGPQGPRAGGPSLGPVGNNVGPTIGPAPGPSGGNRGALAGSLNIDSWLDQNAAADKTQALQSQSGDLIDTLNAFRGNPWGQGLTNVVERLIPVYGLWDGFRDSWNGMQEQWAVAPDDWFLKSLLAAQMVVSTLSAWASHLGYLVSIVGWATAALEGLGIAINATVGEALNVITLVLDAINVYLGVIGTAYSAYKANDADISETDRIRYKYIAYKQADFTVGNLVNVAFDIASVAGADNFVPNAVLKGVGSTFGKELVKEAVKSTIAGVAGAGGKSIVGLFDPLDAGEKQKLTLTSDIGRLPDDIIGDVSVGLHAVGLISDQTYDRLYAPSAPKNPAPPTTTTAVLGRADQRAAAAPPRANPRQSVPTPDHSPAQVRALAALETDLSGQLCNVDGNIGTLDAAISEGNRGAASVANALPTLDTSIGHGEGIRNDLSGTLPGVSDSIGKGGEIQGLLGQMAPQLGGGAQNAMSRMTGLGRQQVPQPKKREGLLDQAAGWLYDQTVGRAVDALKGAFAGVLEKAMSGAAPVKAGGPAVGAAQSGMQTRVAHAQESQAAGNEALQGASAVVGEREAQRAQGETMQATIASKTEEARASRAGEEEKKAKIAALLAQVREERARQESANVAFAGQYGELLGGGPSQAPAIQQAHADGLSEALGAVEALSDAAVGEVFAALGQLPAAAAAKTKPMAEEFQSEQVVLLSRLVPVVSAAGGLVGQSGDRAWATLQDARSQLMTAEVQIRAQKGSVLALVQRIAQAVDEQPQAAGPSAGAATPRPSGAGGPQPGTARPSPGAGPGAGKRRPKGGRGPKSARTSRGGRAGRAEPGELPAK